MIPSSGAFVFKLDVKHFYLVGSKEQLTRALLSGWSHSILEGYALCLLLDSQYVQHACKPELYKVQQGLGQGLPRASEACDLACFLQRR